MVHEAFGLDEVTRRNADRLARAGYLTLAVDLFSTGGGTVRCLVRTMRTMMRGEGQAYVDIETATSSSPIRRTAPARSGSSASAWAAGSRS
jgi:carboxymethylenebutenolidase